MKNELSCDLVRDLLPGYVEGLASQATTEAVENHLKDCDKCKQLIDSVLGKSEKDNASIRDIDYLKTIRKKNQRRVLTSILVTGLMIAAVLFVWIQYNSVLNVLDIVYSSDHSRALVIYDKDISGDSDNESDFFIKQYNDLTDSDNDMKLRWFGGFMTHNTLNIIAHGPYRGSLWLPDGNMFIVNCGNGEISLDCLVGSHSPNIHLFISGLLKEEINKQFGYEISEESPGYEGVMLTALQWSEDSERILINYVITDTADEKHSGYLWYNCYDNSIYGLVENG